MITTALRAVRKLPHAYQLCDRVPLLVRRGLLFLAVLLCTHLLLGCPPEDFFFLGHDLCQRLLLLLVQLFERCVLSPERVQHVRNEYDDKRAQGLPVGLDLSLKLSRLLVQHMEVLRKFGRSG
jgi:hypothetical protein